MKKIAALLGLFLVVFIVCTITTPNILGPQNISNVLRNTAFYGLMGLGVAMVIITSGIDLSLGAVAAFCGCLLPLLLTVSDVSTEVPLKLLAIDQKAKTVEVRLLNPSDQFPKIAGKFRLQYQRYSDKAPENFAGASVEKTDSGATIRLIDLPIGLEAGNTVSLARLHHMNVPLALAITMLVAAGIGLTHGLLITKLKLQPFVVTLCGLLIYRSLARWMTGDKPVGFGTDFKTLGLLAQGKPFSLPIPFLNWISEGKFSRTVTLADGTVKDLDFIGWLPIPMPLIFLLIVGVILGIFLNRTIYGRYMMALGRNEQAARFSGIRTDRMVIAAYVICAALAGFVGILLSLDTNQAQPGATAQSYELYAIAAAVLGGCSLRGGEGSVIGVMLGGALLPVLFNAMNFQNVPQALEMAVLGLVILAAVVTDEIVKRTAAKRRARQEAEQIAKGS